MPRTGGTRWFWLSLAILAADRASKFAIERCTGPFFRRPVISNIVTLVHNQNPGIAFGIFSEATSHWISPLLVVISLVVIVLLIWLLVTGRAGDRLAQSGVALILGGAAGNVLDRLMHGGVTDFLEVRLGTYHWPAFNVADSAITIGAILVLIELLFAKHHSSDTAERRRE